MQVITKEYKDEDDKAVAVCYGLLHRDSRYFVASPGQDFNFIMTFEDEGFWTNLVVYNERNIDIDEFKRTAERDVFGVGLDYTPKRKLFAAFSMLQGYLIRTTLTPKP